MLDTGSYEYGQLYRLLLFAKRAGEDAEIRDPNGKVWKAPELLAQLIDVWNYPDEWEWGWFHPYYEVSEGRCVSYSWDGAVWELVNPQPAQLGR